MAVQTWEVSQCVRDRECCAEVGRNVSGKFRDREVTCRTCAFLFYVELSIAYRGKWSGLVRNLLSEAIGCEAAIHLSPDCRFHLQTV